VKIMRSKYLIKCEMPGCSNVALNTFSSNSDDTLGMAICEKCIKSIIEKYKKVEKNNEKEKRI